MLDMTDRQIRHIVKGRSDRGKQRPELVVKLSRYERTRPFWRYFGEVAPRNLDRDDLPSGTVEATRTTHLGSTKVVWSGTRDPWRRDWRAARPSDSPCGWWSQFLD
jgi:hypothetical protein